jgi:hypothetical protein
MIEEKEELLISTGFPTPPRNQEKQLQTAGNIHNKITQETLQKAIFEQSKNKAPGPHRLTLKAIRMIWTWEPKHIVDITRQCLRIGTHPKTWKVTKGVILRKANKPDYNNPKAYRIICLLNCMGKIVEKVVAALLSETIDHKLYKGQFGCRKRHSVMDTAACMTEHVYQNWGRGKISGSLLMDVKGVFDHVSRTCLTDRLQGLEADPELVRWTNSFMTEQKASLIINGHETGIKPTNTGIPQGSPVSSILFVIYISGVFDQVEQKTGATGLSFIDDISWIVSGNNIKEITEILEECGKIAMEWAQQNAVEFDGAKTAAILFTKKRKTKDTQK